MHIYFLSKDPTEIPLYLTDKDLKRGIIDTTQILCTSFRQIEGNKEADNLHLYKSVYPKHKVTAWVSQTKGNFTWMLALGVFLVLEFQKRFHSSHPAVEVIENLHTPGSLKSNSIAPFPRTFPNQYRTEDTIISYRLFYCSEKLHNPTWTGRQKPEWMKNYGI